MPKNLLLADDSITIQKVVGITFANEDYKVIPVDNGEDAISKAREVRPDVILADVVMPRKNGYEVCEAVKADPALKGIPVILLAGTFEAFDEARARAARADGHIAKPFESQALINKVKELVEGKAPVASAAAAAPRPAAAPAAPLPAPRPAAPPQAGARPPPGAPARPVGPVPPGARPPAPGMPPPRPAGPMPPGARPPMPVGARPGAPLPPGARPPGPGMPPGARPGVPMPPGARPPGARPPGPVPPGARPPAPGMPPAAARPIPPAAPRPVQPPAAAPRPAPVPMPAPAPAPAPAARPAPRKDPFGLGEAAGSAAPPPAAREPDLGFEDVQDAAGPSLDVSVEEPARPDALGGELELPDAGAETPELAPAHTFVPPAESTGHRPEAPAGDSGEVALRQALSKASREVIERVVWEVVPELAETIIRENLDRLVKGRQK